MSEGYLLSEQSEHSCKLALSLFLITYYIASEFVFIYYFSCFFFLLSFPFSPYSLNKKKIKNTNLNLLLNHITTSTPNQQKKTVKMWKNQPCYIQPNPTSSPPPQTLCPHSMVNRNSLTPAVNSSRQPVAFPRNVPSRSTFHSGKCPISPPLDITTTITPTVMMLPTLPLLRMQHCCHWYKHTFENASLLHTCKKKRKKKKFEECSVNLSFCEEMLSISLLFSPSLKHCLLFCKVQLYATVTNEKNLYHFLFWTFLFTRNKILTLFAYTNRLLFSSTQNKNRPNQIQKQYGILRSGRQRRRLATHWQDFPTKTYYQIQQTVSATVLPNFPVFLFYFRYLKKTAIHTSLQPILHLSREK